jgi:hypothetical protein
MIGWPLDGAVGAAFADGNVGGRGAKGSIAVGAGFFGSPEVIGVVVSVAPLNGNESIRCNNESSSSSC